MVTPVSRAYVGIFFPILLEGRQRECVEHETHLGSTWLCPLTHHVTPLGLCGPKCEKRISFCVIEKL